MRHHWCFSVRDQRGVTLVELLVTMGLLSIFLVILTTIFTSSVDMQTQTGSYSAVTSDGRFVLARLSYDIRRATAITAPATVGASDSSLTLTIGGSIYTYAINDGHLTLNVDGVSSALTGDRTVISDLTFQTLGTASQTSVRYTFTVTANAGHHDDTQTYTSTTERRL